MKRTLLLTALLILPFSVLAQELKLIYSFTNYADSSNNYVEINTSIDASGLEYVKKTNGKYQATLEMTLIIYSDATYSEAMYVEKRNILSPEIADTQSRNFYSLYDVQRAALPNGDYPFYMNIKDKNSQEPAHEIRDVIKIHYDHNQLEFSDIKLIDSFVKTKAKNIYSKDGYDMYPYLFESVSENAKKLTFYGEIYNVYKLFGKNKPYIIGIAIEDFNTSRAIDGIGLRKKSTTKSIERIFETLDISNLKAGYYNLAIEVRDSNNFFYDNKKYAFVKEGNSFEGANLAYGEQDTYLDSVKDSLILLDDIESLYPVANKSERNFIDKGIKGKTTEQLRMFLYSYWAANYPDNPQAGYEQYHKRAEYVKSRFSTPNKKGFYTDMGRIYLIYGEPTNIIDERNKVNTAMRRNDMAANSIDPDVLQASTTSFTYLPYQMWRYDQTPFGETNRTFVFYAPMNDVREYRLLHSNATGEISTLFWEHTLSNKNLPYYSEGEAGLQFKRGY
ncbi:MAG: GWxTD domain-containing protein [Bacteroidales bacterium]|jgi:GWxTD domain-containing protein|nr:GWxTD domain-containing protein [Bacteroidales bacterium]